MADRQKFWESQKGQSKVKAEIVQKYFRAWSSVMVSTIKKYGANPELAYVDLLAGQGSYEDGKPSTPLMVLEYAINNRALQAILKTHFNDADPDAVTLLVESIKALPGIDKLVYYPKVTNFTVTRDVISIFGNIPTLSFIDPWGYKGLSLELITKLLTPWGSDCIFFFNYNRINPGISNPSVYDPMVSLFGKERFDYLSKRVVNILPHMRELTIIEEMAQAVKDAGGKYVLPFRFKDESGNRTKHYLFFVSKDFRGYEIMKEIMANESSTSNQGVPSFEYSPADERQPILFGYSQPLDKLETSLLSEFEGSSLRVRKIYEEHSIDKPYIERNYKAALRKMAQEGKVQFERVRGKIRKGTLPDDVIVHFQRG